MKTSEFCLLPRGWGLWTLRFFEAALAGCLPVLLSVRDRAHKYYVHT